jgi:hypothetical protein
MSVRDLPSLLLILLGTLGIHGWRPGLAADFQAVKARSDAYLLPPIDQTYVASLGYRSALADLIFGHVLVAYGLHFQEKRLFQHVGDYLDVINRLDPQFRDPYRFADTLLTLQPEAPPPDFYRRARQIQERGLKELPNDQELWATAGQFITYLAPGQLTDPDEKLEYQLAGTRILMRACELIGSNTNIPYHCITAANILNRQGDRVVARQFLQRLRTVSDDPNIQEMAAGYLKNVLGDPEQEEIAARWERFRSRWQSDLPFSSRAEIDALGPAFDSARCAGSARALTPECVSSWQHWSDTYEADDSTTARPR